MITFWRIFKTGFRNLLRHAWLSVAATAIMVVTLVIVSFFIFAGVFLRKGLDAVKEKIDITIYLVDGSTPQQVQQLQSQLSASDNVKSVTFQSKADVLHEYEVSSDPDKRSIAEAAKASGAGLGAVLQVRVNDLSQTSSVDNLLKEQQFKKVVDRSSLSDNSKRKNTVVKIGKISNMASKIGAIISVAFLVIALLIIFNTIRMAIFTRREEIEIMKLVGATKWFIRGPFIIEGALYGIIGGALAIAIIFPLLSTMKPLLVKAFESQNAVNSITARTGMVIAFEFVAGIFIGIVSSWLALMRHLKL